MNMVLHGEAAVKYQIFKAMTDSFTDLSVVKICEKAGISRRTFYNHFSSIWDVPFWYSELGFVRFLHPVGNGTDWLQGMTDYLSFLKEEGDVFSRTYDLSYDASAFSRSLIENEASILRAIEGRDSVNDAVRFETHVFAQTMAVVLLDWFREDMATPPEVLAGLLYPCVPRNLLAVWSSPSGA